MDFIVQFLLFFLMLFLLYVYWRTKEKHSNLPPGPKGLPLVGFIPFFDRKYPCQQFAKLSKKYGSIITIPIGSTNIIVLNDWTAIKECFLVKSEIFSARPYLYLSYKTLQFADIITSDGPRWKEQRRFTMQEMRKLGIGKIEFEHVIMNEVKKITEHLIENNNKVVSMSHLWFIPITNVIFSSVSGKTYDQTDSKMVKFIDYVYKIFENTPVLGVINFMPLLRFVPGPLKSQMSELLENNKQVINYINEQVEEHVRTYENGVPRDFIDVYLAEIFKREGTDNKDSPYQMKYLVGTIYDMFLAGVETMQRTLEFSILYMVHWPEVQCKIQEELDAVIGGHRFITYTDHIYLPYTEAAILEIQRMSTVVPLAYPHTPVVTTEVMGYTFPIGTMVIPNLWAVHNDKRYWKDPDVFRPERFLDQNGKVTKPEYLIPYSIGSRLCLGKSLAKMELFLFFSNILHRFSFHCAPGENPPSLDPVMGITYSPRPFSLLVKQRFND